MSVTFLRDASLRLEGERWLQGWRWHYARGFTIQLGTSLLLVSW